MELQIGSPVAGEFARFKVRFALWVPADNGPTGYAMRQIMPGISARMRVEHEAMLTPSQFERLAKFAADGDQCQFLKDLRNGPNPTTVYAIEIIEPRRGFASDDCTADGGLIVPLSVSEHVLQTIFGAPTGTTEPEAYRGIDDHAEA